MSNIIEKTFALYSNKTESDYWILDPDGKRIPTLATIYTKEDAGKVSIFPSVNIVVYKDEFVAELSPDNIDSREFWKMATDNFPLFSIGGGEAQPYKTIEDVNKATLEMAVSLGCLGAVRDVLGTDKNSLVLEIGPGHGGFKSLLEQNGFDERYYAIDVNPLFKHPRIYQTDGKTIPDTIPNPIDLVYSVNVFQHLSKKQRTSYYRQIIEALKDGGTFIFSMFVVTDDNIKWPCWGTRGNTGKFYCNFFRQLTEIDHIDTLYKELTDIGYSKIEQINPHIDKTNYLAFKVTK